LLPKFCHAPSVKFRCLPSLELLKHRHRLLLHLVLL